MQVSNPQIAALHEISQADRTVLEQLLELHSQFPKEWILAIRTLSRSLFAIGTPDSNINAALSRFGIAEATKFRKKFSVQDSDLTESHKLVEPDPEPKLDPETKIESVTQARLNHALYVMGQPGLFSVFPKHSFRPLEAQSDNVTVLSDSLQAKGVDVFDLGMLKRLLPESDPKAIVALFSGFSAQQGGENRLNPEQKRILEMIRLVERMEADYRKELDRLEFYELVDENAKIPTFPEILAVFKPEDLRQVIDCKFQEPKLVLVPPVSFKHYIKAMNTHPTMSNASRTQHDVYLNGIYNSYANDKAEKWKTYLVEAAINIRPDHHFDYNLNSSMSERLNRFQGHCRVRGLFGVDRWLYSNLMMGGLMEGKPLDNDEIHGKTLTILDKDPAQKNGNVPFAGWFSHGFGVDFSSTPIKIPSEIARFRRSVGGEVQMT